MSIITLTTDFGLKDHYVSSVKGAILKQLPTASIIDISHQIEKYNIPETAFVLKNAYMNFPKGSVHIIGVKTEQSKQAPHVIVYSDGHYFIGSDNGIFYLLLENHIDRIIALPEDASIFPTRDIFVNAACHLISGKPVEELGTIKTELFQSIPFRAASIGDMIRGTAIYVDTYENVVTNISQSLFNQVGKGRPFKIDLKNNEIGKISKSYNEVPEGEIIALFNSSGYLEIALNTAKASSLLYLKINDQITIQFE